MKYAIALALAGIGLISCKNDDYNSNCVKEFSGTYSGVALALDGGESSFAISRTCAMVISGPDDYYKAVANAWELSPYDDKFIRPIYINVRGTILERRGKSPVIEISNDFSVSPEIDDLEARKQFQLRLGIDAPKRLTEPLGAD